ncbi:hypothetical protein KTR66_20700 [Roseococcus sp. SDR]|uniref:hypothetical protein n=1 Tax=Roseococcus sp. SDR TaxID=2835532 RepID=UPI001BCF3D87|nr:hypothetical protein [Roseococcus sp. SDR]MBS7792425.1 hypothetical protein [Roseococcus sp. SDR]MBV1847739.1 hypothetical protein [Roseococcus sp. SDR]
MKKILALAVLATLPALAATQAQAQTTWTGTNLAIAGNRSNGCDLRVVEVSHSGSTLNSIRFGIVNRGASPVRATAEVTLSGNNQRKTGTISGLIAAGQVATLAGFYPFGGSLAGSTMQIRFLGCTAA